MATTTVQDVRETALIAVQQFDPSGDGALPLTPRGLLDDDRAWDDAEYSEILALLVDLETAMPDSEDTEFQWDVKLGEAITEPGVETRRQEVAKLLHEARDPEESRRTGLGQAEGRQTGPCRAYRLYDCTHLPDTSVFCCRINIRDAGWTLGFVIAKCTYSFNG